MHPWICRIPFLKSSRYLHEFPIFAHISLVSFSTSTPEISLFDYLVDKHNFSAECAANVLSSSSTKYLNKPQNADSVLNFLKETGFAKNQIEAVVEKAPRVLSANVETSVKPKIKIFQDLGFHSSDFAAIISASPRILNINVNRLRQSVLGLKNVLGPKADICRLLKKSGFGWLLDRDLDRTLVPNVEYLKSCGICSLLIDSYVCQAPLLFLANQDKLKGFVQRVDEMGVDRKSKSFFQAVRVMSCMSRENWELKLKLFRELGFSEQNILAVFRKYPQAFAVSERKIKEVTQLLLSVEDSGISDIVSTPVLLTYSVEKRLKPRLQVLKALQSKNLLKKKPSLAAFCQMVDANFANKYLIPYSNELGDFCVAS
ncbi:protein SEEDLING LETHAL 1, chloroplastic-like [Euphorbia lathyris]|uniref:protein SEEDLING LETHAL 1, chloroplastic-like n=1 Tax=Euphorbia lathyris TaxID=212925 RepID=UPI0033139F60